jgi:arylsulfatase
VNDQDYQVPFRFIGTLARLTIEVDRPKLTPADEERLQAEGQRNNRASE